MTIFRARAVAMSVFSLMIVWGVTCSAQTTERPDVGSMVQAVVRIADQLSETLAALPDRMIETVRSAEEAELQLNELRKSAQAVVDGLDETSTFWTEFSALKEFTDDRWERSRDRLGQTGENRWRVRTERWDQQRATLRRIEQDIIQERSRAEHQLSRIERDRDYIIDSIILEEVEDAIEELEKARGQLVAMNDGVQQLLTAINTLPGASAGVSQ